MVTMNLKELSILLGLSPTTVSRALNGYPEVSEATRQRVLTAAASTGYQPNQNAQRLAAGQANSVAVVWTSSRDPHERQFESTLFRCLTEASSQLDVHLISVPGGCDDGLSRARRLFSAGSINAALFINPARFPANPGLPFPSLVFGRRPAAAPGLSWADIDYRAMSYHAVEFLFQLGHHHVAVIDNRARPIGEIVSGAEDAARSWSSHRPVRTSCTKQFIDSWSAPSSHCPTAFLCPDRRCAVDVANQAEAEGFVVGRDISIVTFDHSSSHDYLPIPTPLFTSLRLDLDTAATTILLALQELLETGTRERRAPILLPSDLVLGETTSTHSLQNLEEEPILRNQNFGYGSP